MAVATQTVTTSIVQQNVVVSTVIGTVQTTYAGAGETVTVTASGSPQAGAQAISGNSVTIDNLGTLPISPLVFGILAFVVGLFVMLVLSLICCRRGQSNPKLRDEEFETISNGMNTTSQRTFTNSTLR